ncbi:unnamed protein product [Boreogadus saida]
MMNGLLYELNASLGSGSLLSVVRKTLIDACELTLDPNTANGRLFLSEDNRKVTRVREQTVGVYLDRPAGTLSFYRVSPGGGGSSDTLTHIHTFWSSFTQEDLLPGFGLLFGLEAGFLQRFCAVNFAYVLQLTMVCYGLIPPDTLRQRYGCGTSWPRSPQQIGSTLINETISTGRGCGTSQQRPRSGSPCRSAIIP